MIAASSKASNKKSKAPKPKGKARFLDFNIQTQQHNSGVQLYGAGQSYTAPKSAGSARARGMTMTVGKAGRTGGPMARRELVGNVVSSVLFQSVQYSIQPASAVSFPWIADIAKKFQKWRCVKLRYEYIPTVGEFADAGKQGRIVLAANYDPLDPKVATIVQACDIVPSRSGVPAAGLLLDLDPRQVTPVPYLVRPGQVPAGGTLTAYDGGVVYVCVEGTAGTVTDGTKLGELYVEYDFEFYDPIIPGTAVTTAATHSSLILARFDVLTSFATNTWYTFPDMTFNDIAAWNGLGITILPSNAGLVFPPGRYLISGTGGWTGTAIASVQSRFTADGSTTLANSYSLESGGSQSSQTSNLDYTFTTDVALTIQPQFNISGTGTLAAMAGQWFVITVRTI